jgi:hypothetical protein
MKRHLLTTTLLSAAALAALPTYASARKDQLSVIQDDARVVAADSNTRNATLDEMKSLGADVVKVSISWRELAGGGKPSNPADPGAYPSSKWAGYDAAIQGAASRGMGVLVNIGGPAPDWAVKKSTSPAGVYRPNAAEFGQFAKAVGTRYSGSYTPSRPPPGAGGGGGQPCLTAPIIPCGGSADASSLVGGLIGSPSPSPQAQSSAAALPAVRTWSVWNEPNLPVFLLPQRSSSKSHFPVSPTLYRSLYLQAHAGLEGSGHGSDTILMGELLPVGKSSKTPRSSIRPLEFLRELACVDRRLRSYRGRSAKVRRCKGFKAIPMSGVAYHPYALAGGPTKRPPNRDDATIGTLSRVTQLVDRLRARHRFAGPRRMPLWLTEFGVQTDPPDYLFGAPIKRVPTYMGMSERLSYRNSRVLSYSQYPLVDDHSNSGFQSGLRFLNGKAKPGVYAEYQLPIFVRRSGSGVEWFGGVRAATGGEVTLYSRVGKKGKFRKLGTAKLNSRGYFDKRMRASNARTRQFLFKFGRSKSIAVTAH